MQIVKEIQSKVYKDYFFIKGKVDIDSEYFIEKIKKGCSDKDAINYQTNILGGHTSWKYFVEDLKFNKVLFKLLDYLDNNLNLPSYQLTECWGFQCHLGSKTRNHNHSPMIVSGVIYLNEHPQILEFTDIKQTVKPEIGSFVLFSPFLNHGCNRNHLDIIKYGISFNMSLS